MSVSETVAVLGAGTMGHGIAQVAAMAGHDVRLRDVERDLVDAGRERIAWSLEKLAERGDVTESEAAAALDRVETFVDAAAAVGGADFVIEAVPERADIKHAVYGDVAPHLGAETVLVTNTSSLSVTDLGEVSGRPETFVGMHFFNPPVRMRLVEVVRGAATSDRTVERAESLAASMDKEPIRVRDSPGFVVNRILFPFLNEAGWLRESGAATIDVSDATAKAGLALPMGPFELADHIGLDVVKETLDSLHERLDEGYKPCPGFARKVAAGDLGRKSGCGFYDYDGGEPSPAPDAARDDVERRFVAVMANETAKLLADGVAPPADIDRAMELGAGFPRGPTRMAETHGTRRLARTLRKLAGRTGGGRYEPAPYLVSLAEKDEALSSSFS